MTDDLRRARSTDTIVVAVLGEADMVLQTRIPRGPDDLVHLGRRILEEARDVLRERPTPTTMREQDALDDKIAMVENAIDCLPDPAAEKERAA